MHACRGADCSAQINLTGVNLHDKISFQISLESCDKTRTCRLTSADNELQMD